MSTEKPIEEIKVSREVFDSLRQDLAFMIGQVHSLSNHAEDVLRCTKCDPRVNALLKQASENACSRPPASQCTSATKDDKPIEQLLEEVDAYFDAIPSELRSSSTTRDCRSARLKNPSPSLPRAPPANHARGNRYVLQLSGDGNHNSKAPIGSRAANHQRQRSSALRSEAHL